MGAAASFTDPNTPMSLDKVKELAGDNWSPILETKFNAKWEETEHVTLADLKLLAPLLFVQDSDKLSLEELVAATAAAGTEWNEQLQSIFDTHKSSAQPPENQVTEGAVEAEASTAVATEALLQQDVIEFSQWKKLVPIVFETSSEREVRLDAEWKALLARKSEGNVVINYEMYNEEFPISKNSITAARIDEDYGLTDVMPGCRLRLSRLDGLRRTVYENENPERGPAPWVKEDPEGTFQELVAGEKYYCIVIENPAQYKKDMEEIAKRLEGTKLDLKDEGKPRQEGCSCLYGNPCQDKYVCLDWDNRWKVAMANGMTQAEIKRAGIIT